MEDFTARVNRVSQYVQPIHFEDFDGSQFERLVFAYHARSENWRSLEWYGQTGSDLGRDIWGIREDDTAGGESICIQCVNRKNLTFVKVEKDIAKVLRANNGIPHRFRIVARSKISAGMRDRIRKHVKSIGIRECDVWSGAEFEEFLRQSAESILKRFVEGEPFPDAPADLRKLAASSQPVSDEEALALFARVFDRPAFYTPIHQESNLGDFKQAITDTIQALGTGIWKARDGRLIDRISSRHQLKSDTLRTKMQAVETALSRLRAKFDEMMKSGILARCQCNDPQCPVYFFKSPEAVHELERFRKDALAAFQDAYPAFRSSLW
jgi:hypothetical protein